MNSSFERFRHSLGPWRQNSSWQRERRIITQRGFLIFFRPCRKKEEGTRVKPVRCKFGRTFEKRAGNKLGNYFEIADICGRRTDFFVQTFPFYAYRFSNPLPFKLCFPTLTSDRSPDRVWHLRGHTKLLIALSLSLCFRLLPRNNFKVAEFRNTHVQLDKFTGTHGTLCYLVLYVQGDCVERMTDPDIPSNHLKLTKNYFILPSGGRHLQWHSWENTWKFGAHEPMCIKLQSKLFY